MSRCSRAVAVLLEVFVRYSRYVSVLKWLTLSLFAYVGDGLRRRRAVGRGRCGHRPAAAVASTADYMTRGRRRPRHHHQPLPVLLAGRGGGRGGARSAPSASRSSARREQAPAEFQRIRIDTYVGMALSNLVALFIIITTAATLHAHGVTDIQTSAQAAEALRPIAGPFAFASSPPASSARACWRCRCWRARRPTRSARPWAGMSASRASRRGPRRSTPPSRSATLIGVGAQFHRRSIRSRRCSGAR